MEVLLCELSVLDLSIRPENRLPYLNFSNDNSLGTFIYLFIFIIIIFCYFTILYWFCRTSTCIHHGYTRVPHPEPPLPPPFPYHPSGSSQCTSPKLPVSRIEPGLAIRFLYDIMHVFMPFSQIIPPSLSHRVQKTVLYICVSFAVSHTGLLLPSLGTF